MYHGDTNERQRSELHMVRKDGGKGKMAVNRTSTGNLQIFSRPFSSRVTGHRQQPLIHSLLIYQCGRALSRASFETPTLGTD